MKPKPATPALKEQFAKAKVLIEQKQYDKARALLITIDHPTANTWLAKLDVIAPAQAASPAAGRVKAKTGKLRLFRNVWGVLTLMSLGWICYGLMVSSQAYTEVATETTSEAGQAGAAIGASMGMGIFICIGLPFLLLFLILYSRAGSAIRREEMHVEMMAAVQEKK